MAATLFVVSTPIGNLGDITLRAIETLRQSDQVACEDTRRTEQLMRHLGIKKPLVRYDEHSHEKSSRQIIQALTEGKIVSLVTDAGTPTISDPGSRLTRAVIEAGFKVIPIPGAVSPIAALSASGIVGEGFVFLGFLPRKNGPAKRALQEALGLGKTVVLMESPFRVSQSMELISEIAPDSHVVVAREITKLHEEFIRGDVAGVRKQLETTTKKGEHIILISPMKSERTGLKNQ